MKTIVVTDLEHEILIEAIEDFIHSDKYKSAYHKLNNAPDAVSTHFQKFWTTVRYAKQVVINAKS
jgi:hypothetical protein